MSKTGKTKSLAGYPIWMYQNNIKIEAKLFAIADEQKNVGKEDLANFVLSCSKALSDLLENTWKMEPASKSVFYSKQTHMKVIPEHSHMRCADSL